MQRRPQRHAASKQAQRNRARRRERVLAVNEKTRTVDSITGTTEIEAAALLTSDENSFTYKSFGAPPLTLRKCKKNNKSRQLVLAKNHQPNGVEVKRRSSK